MFVLLFLLCPGANPLNLSAKTRYSPILPHSHPGWHAWNAAARAQHRPPASPAGWHAHTFAYPEIITLIDYAIAHNCAPALTGIISRLRTRLRTPISSVAKYSLHVSIAPKKIIKAQWSSVGTVFTPYMIVYLVISLPKIPCMHRICMVLSNPTIVCCAGFCIHMCVMCVCDTHIHATMVCQLKCT